MAKKYDLISELYDRTAKMVTSNPDAWQAFLRSACYNFRLRFDEQLLVYAQRPDATAVLEIEKWNGKFDRWVNKGARGIAVFEDADRSSQRLKHYFDISDTHANIRTVPIPVWEMKPEHTAEVIEALESTFGELSYKETLEEAIVSAAENAVGDNLQDYLDDLIASKDGSLMEELDDYAIGVEFRQLVTDSVACMVMTRLGINPNDYFGSEDFREIYNFNTPDTLNAVGLATSDIAQMALHEISRTILSLQRKNRTFANQIYSQYNGYEIKTERSDEHGSQLHDAGRLSSAQPEAARTAGSGTGALRTDEAQVSEGAPQSTVLQPADEGQADRASVRDGAESIADGGNADSSDGGAAGLNGGNESDGYDGLGAENEQSEELGAGNRVDGLHLRLNWHDRSTEDHSIPFLADADTINAILVQTPYLKQSKDVIRAFFEEVHSDAEKVEFVQSLFNNDYTEIILDDGRRMGYKTYENVLHLWEGKYTDRKAECFYDWGVVASHFDSMRLLGQLQDNLKPLPSMEGQQLALQKAEEKNSAFTFSQEIIDRILTRGSGISEGKFRIYEQFQKSLSSKENQEFLKNEYGWGGHYPAIVGTKIDEQHDGKGIHLTSGALTNPDGKITLNWNQVEKRIAELIKLDRYLNPKEMEVYPKWLTEQEERRREAAERKANRETLSAAPVEQGQIEKSPAHYEYHLGDTVYLGADEFEILSFDENRVMLYDISFPLINREEKREDFDRMVAENPMNDHLKVKPTTIKGKPVAEERFEIWTISVPSEGDRYAVYDNLKNDYYIDDDNLTHWYPTKAEAEDYLADVIKREFTDKVITLHRLGDFYEMFGNEAQNAAKALDLALTSRQIDGERVPMCGIPVHAKDRYIERLEKAGYTVVTVEEAVHEKISQRTGRQVESAADPLMEQAKQLIVDFLKEKYGEDTEANFDNMTDIGIAYTTTEDGKHEVQVSVDLEHLKMNTFVDGKQALSIQYHDLKDLIDNGLTDMDFDDLVYLTEEQLAPFDLDEHSGLLAAAMILAGYTYVKALDDGVLVFRDENGETTAMQGWDNVESYLKNVSLDNPDHQETLELLLYPERNTAQNGTKEEHAERLTPTWERKKEKANTFDLHPEIPMADRHTFDLASHEVEEVNKKERFHRNYAAIITLKKCQEEHRFATPEEQIILSKYVGWGGIPEAFDERADSWRNEYTMLKAALTPEEYDSARESTLTAFYTPPTVITAIYKAMEQMGFKEGNILEPSCGIGNFIGMLPQSMQDAKMYGVELDTISARIAQQLYQKSSIAAQPYEKADIPDSFFDAVVGNVPFGNFSVADKRYDKNHFLIHDYFFAKSLDKLRPGGVMALVTSKGTMDKESNAVRKYIAQRADLLGAIRLPNNTFKGNAGTEVVSDILILQKRDRMIDIEPDWVHLGTDENGNRMNSYFVQHPEMVLGESKMVSGRFGEELTVEPYEGADLAELLNEAVSNIHGEFSEYEMDDELDEEDNSIPADPTVRNFSYTVVDDTIYFRENSRMAPVKVSATAANRIKGMIRIRDAVRDLLEIQTENFPDDQIKAAQKKLNELYDSFTAKYGLINSRGNTTAFSQDSSYSLLSALEVLDEDGNLERKADIFSKRTIKAHKVATSVDTASEALAISMGERACVDMAYMCSLCGKSEEEIFSDLKGVIFLNPKGTPKYLMADEYLSGNVREKLNFARRSAEAFPELPYKDNIEALEKVQPKDLTASEISVRLGATWLPPDIVQDFVNELLETPYYLRYRMKVHYSPYTGDWNIENKNFDRSNVKANTTYGTKRINAYKIIEETLNLKDVRIFDYVEDEWGKKKPVLNTKETAIAQAKQESIKEAFKNWIWNDPSRREQLVQIYNEKFNSVRPREYDGSHITFSGMNPEIELRDHQKNAVAHVLYGGNTLLAHAVGAGKTYEMVAAAMESKRLGLCSKSLFVVPNHLTEQWAADFLQLYPAANILVATKKDFETKNRKKFCGRIATGDYDAIIIGHSQFEKIPMSVERQVMLLEQEKDEIIAGIRELKENHGEKFSIKQLEKSKKSIETKLAKLNDQTRKDDVVTFEELGIDRLFVDESHYYKNLYLYTKMRNVGGIAQTEAQKSSDLYMKCRYLDELTGGRGTVFATGTPISNSMVELYTIQRYLQYEILREHGLQHFDAWAALFGETVNAVELKPEGYTFIGR